MHEGVCNPFVMFMSNSTKYFYFTKNIKITNIFQTLKTKPTHQMPISQINKNLNQATYFITPTIKNWYYIFDRHNRFEIISDSLKFCQKHKGLKIYSYVFMLNHLHLIIKSPDVLGFIRDFKKFTSKKLLQNIRKFEPNVLDLFQSDNGSEFWTKDNQPKIIENEKFAYQKANYIHNNPVVKDYVSRPEYWKWSSANPDGDIDIVKF